MLWGDVKEGEIGHGKRRWDSGFGSVRDVVMVRGWEVDVTERGGSFGGGVPPVFFLVILFCGEWLWT